ncbi:MAG: metalloregulator ArsR/SmtB family transcription factor [Actinomycetota bacterium]
MKAEMLTETFAALADETRRAMIARLAKGEATIAELGEPFAMSQPAISKHVKVLEQAGLITRRREAQRCYCRLDVRALHRAVAEIDGYRQTWEQRFGKLDDLLEKMKQDRNAKGGKRS